MNDLYGRKGKIAYSGKMIREETEIVEYEMKEVGFVPLCVEYFPVTDIYEMVGVSSNFDQWPEGYSEPPRYIFNPTASTESKNPGNIIKIEVVRC